MVYRQNDNTSTGLGRGRLVPSSHKGSKLDTQSSESSAEEMRESGRTFQSLIVWGKKFFLKASLLAEGI